MLSYIDYHYRDAWGYSGFVKREYVPASYERSNDVRLVGFGLRELVELRRVLDIYDVTFSTALDALRREFDKEYRERAWREHFGILTEIWS